MRETIRFHSDINTLAAALTFKSIPIVILSFVIGGFNIVKIMNGMNQRIEVANAFADQRSSFGRSAGFALSCPHGRRLGRGSFQPLSDCWRARGDSFPDLRTAKRPPAT